MSEEKKNETKAEKFMRLGEYRINKIITAINSLENLANKSAYEYTQNQVEEIFSVLENRLAEVKAKFTTEKSKENVVFSFKEWTNRKNKIDNTKQP